MIGQYFRVYVRVSSRLLACLSSYDSGAFMLSVMWQKVIEIYFHYRAVFLTDVSDKKEFSKQRRYCII